MKFTVTVLSRCAGGGHIYLRITHPTSGKTRDIIMSQGEVSRDPDALTPEEAMQRVEERVITAVKEANPANLAQLRAALEGREFWV